MSGFKIGEIVIFQNIIHAPEFNGVECEIIGGLMLRASTVFHSGEFIMDLTYHVRLANGAEHYQQPYTLRRKSPPASTADEREYAELMDRLMNRKEQTA